VGGSGWRRLHNEELHNLYASPNIIRAKESRRMRWAGNVARKGRGKTCIQNFGRVPEGKRPLGRSRCRREDNIKMDVTEMTVGRCGPDACESG
jgi:hypothetical protein